MYDHPRPANTHLPPPPSPSPLQVPGSVAHLLKAQGLVQSLSVGTGDEVRLGRGWMFWGATLSLTQEGEQQLHHVLATLQRAVQVSARPAVHLTGGGGRVFVCVWSHLPVIRGALSAVGVRAVATATHSACAGSVWQPVATAHPTP